MRGRMTCTGMTDDALIIVLRSNGNSDEQIKSILKALRQPESNEQKKEDTADDSCLTSPTKSKPTAHTAPQPIPKRTAGVSAELQTAVSEILDQTDQTRQNITSEVQSEQRQQDESQVGSDQEAEANIQPNPVGEQPAQAVIAENPVGEQPAQAVVAENPVGEQPAQVVIAENPVGEQPAQAVIAENPVGEQPAQVVGAENPVGEQPAQVVGAENPVGEQPAQAVVAENAAAQESISTEAINQAQLMTTDSAVQNPDVQLPAANFNEAGIATGVDYVGQGARKKTTSKKKKKKSHSHRPDQRDFLPIPKGRARPRPLLNPPPTPDLIVDFPPLNQQSDTENTSQGASLSQQPRTTASQSQNISEEERSARRVLAYLEGALDNIEAQQNDQSVGTGANAAETENAAPEAPAELRDDVSEMLGNLFVETVNQQPRQVDMTIYVPSELNPTAGSYQPREHRSQPNLSDAARPAQVNLSAPITTQSEGSMLRGPQPRRVAGTNSLPAPSFQMTRPKNQNMIVSVDNVSDLQCDFFQEMLPLPDSILAAILDIKRQAAQRVNAENQAVTGAQAAEPENMEQQNPSEEGENEQDHHKNDPSLTELVKVFAQPDWKRKLLDAFITSYQNMNKDFLSTTGNQYSITEHLQQELEPPVLFTDGSLYSSHRIRKTYFL